MVDLERMRRTGIVGGVPSWGEDIKAGGSEGLGLALSIFNLIESTRESLVAGKVSIDRDERLTPKGKGEARQALGEKQSKQITEIRQNIAQLKRTRDKKAATATVRDPFSGDETALAVWVAMTATLLPDDPLRVKLAYEEALERGDLRTVVAIENLPHLHPGRPNDTTMSEMRAARVRADDPVAARSLSEQDRAVADLEALAADLAGEVRQLTGEARNVIDFISDGTLRDGDGRVLDPDTRKPIESDDDGADKDTEVA